MTLPLHPFHLARKPNVLAAGATALIACLVLIGWTFDVEILKRIVPGLVAMNPMTAMAFLLAAISLALFSGEKSDEPTSSGQWLARACAFAVALIGVARMVAIIGGPDLGIDRLLFSAKLGVGFRVPNVMAPNTALSFVLVGNALLLVHSRKRRTSPFVCIAALVCGFEALLAILGYAYGIGAFYGLQAFIPMALHTAVAFLVITFGIMACQAQRGFLAVIIGKNIGGLMARRLLPAAILVPAVIGWLRLEGQRMGFFDSEFGVALYTVTNMLVFGTLVACNAYLLFKTDAARVKADERLRRAHEELEAHVQERTAELSKANAQLEKAREELEERVKERTATLAANKHELEAAVHANQLIMDKSRDVICTVDEGGRFVSVSAACETVWGYKPGELAGKAYIDMVHPDDREKTNAVAAAIIAGDPVSDFENRYFRKDGSLIDVMWSAYWSEADRIMFAVAHDITERAQNEKVLKQAKEEADRANRSKSEFLANMSHEIRTPMNGIIGMTDLALETKLNREQREYLGMVKTSAHSLLGLINDILDFSKIEAGKLELEAIDFSLRDCIAGMLKPLGIRADQKGLELVADIPADVPDHMVGDPTRLRQILINLTDNAIKFTERGEVIVKVINQLAPYGESHLHFSVTDTGIGIPPEKQCAIFEAFAQADGSTTRTHGGTGLGLSIASQLIRKMRGRIWIESKVGEGTTFHFTVRLGVRDTPAPTARHLDPQSLDGLRALIVDDNAVNRRILQEMLSNWRMQPTVVPSGAAALDEMLRAAQSGTPFPLVLLDAVMPEMDGFELAENIKQRPELTASTVMMLSSAMPAGAAARCNQLGIAGVLTKPVTQSDLLDAILLAISDNDAATQSLAHETCTQSGITSLRILLAEDNIVNRAVATGILQKQGHTLLHAANGREAVEATNDGNIDLIFMDVQMPEMDGLEATRQIREMEDKIGGHTPIVAMTAHAMAGDRERCLAAGMDDYISKPLKKEDLLEVIQKFSGDSHAVECAKETPAPVLRTISSREEILQQLDGDEALFEKVIELFQENTPQILDSIRQSLLRHNAKELEAYAHKLLSSLGAFGADGARAVAMRLEEQGRLGDFEKADERLASLEREINKIHDALGEFSGTHI